MVKVLNTCWVPASRTCNVALLLLVVGTGNTWNSQVVVLPSTVFAVLMIQFTFTPYTIWILDSTVREKLSPSLSRNCGESTVALTKTASASWFITRSETRLPPVRESWIFAERAVVCWLGFTVKARSASYSTGFFICTPSTQDGEESTFQDTLAFTGTV